MIELPEKYVFADEFSSIVDVRQLLVRVLVETLLLDGILALNWRGSESVVIDVLIQGLNTGVWGCG